MQERLSGALLVADFFTASHRMSGNVDVRQKKLADQLNDQNTAFIQIEDIYVSSIERPADITSSFPTSTIRKDSIIASVVSTQDNGLPREHTYGSYFGAHLQNIFLVAPPFEIRGYLRISGRWDLRTVLTSGTDDFVTVLDGTMTLSANPAITFAGGAILVNKTHIGALCEEAE